MKVASLALDDYSNYGNNLQKYALQHTLKKFVDFTELLWHNANAFFSETAQFSYMPKPFLKNCDPFSQQKYILREAVRINKIKEFENRYIKVRFDIPYIEEIADEYDYFVVGSDQVWQPLWIESKYFLEFVPREKRIAYAASIAAPFIPDQLKEFFKRGISGFDYISVREENAVKIIKELTGQDALLVLDPTLLLTLEEWLDIAQKPSWLNEKYQRGYILTYYLRTEPHPIIKIIAQKLNLPVINLLDWDNYWHYIVGPEEFIYLFANAALIFTNSFHGVAFSINFKKPFINLEVDAEKNMSTRIPGLLKMFNLEDRIAKPGKNYSIDYLFEIDFSTRDKILLQERNKAFQFLLNALSGAGKMGGGR